MPEYLSGKKRKQSLGVSSYSENKDTASIIGNVLVSSGKIGVGTTLPTQDVDVQTIRIRDTVYDYTNSGGVFGYYLVKDTDGIKWVAVPPIDSNAIFVAENNNILGVSSFTGLNIISDDYIGVSTNPVNTNFADIRYIPSWVKNGELGIYTSKNVGIGTSIPTADFQVGVGTTGVTIDGAAGVVSALAYYGDDAFIKRLIAGVTTVSDEFTVVGLGTTLVAVNLASAGGITTTGGDLYIGGSLFAETINIIDLEVVNINSTGVSTFNQSFTNVGVATTFIVTGIASINDLLVTGVTTVQDLFAQNIDVVGVTTTNTINATTGIITNLTTEVGFITNLVSVAATITNLTAEIITGIGSAYLPVASIDSLVGLAATFSNLDSDNATIDYQVGIGATFTDVNVTSGIVSNLISAASTISTLDVDNATIDYQTGIGATFTNLNATTGIVTNFTSVNATSNNLVVTGITTLGNSSSGIVTVIGDLYVGDKLYTTGLQQFDSLQSGDLNVTGIATINDAFLTDLVADTATFTTLTSTNNDLANIIGVAATITRIETDLIDAEDAVLENLFVSGISTFNSITVVNEVTTGILTVSQLDVQDEFDVYANTSVFHNNLIIQGNLTVNGTETIINTEEKYIKDKQIVLGYSTTNGTNEITANGGGIAIASTIGTPLVSLYVIGVNTLPDTYKQFLWTKAGTYGVGTTDAFLSNYAIGIGSTLVPTGVRLAVGGIQLTDNGIAVPNIVSTGIATFNLVNLNSVEFINLIGAAISANSLKVSGITTLGAPGPSGFTTTLGDLYVGGDLYTKGIQFFDNIGATLLNVTGVGTINTIDVNNGTFDYLVGIAATIPTLNSTNIVSTAASFINLRVAGLSTFTDGPVLVGSGTSTGTLNQRLQVTGGFYASGNAGIGTTNPTSKLDVIGDGRFSGVVTAATFIGSFSGNATTADYADYADFAGVSTSVIGGIGSLTRLSVSGISTFTSGPVLIGSGTSTGTANQLLQVTGGAYYSGNVGIGSTLPTRNLDINGSFRLTGQFFDRFGQPGTQGQIIAADPINGSWYWAPAPLTNLGIITTNDDVTYYPTLRTTGIVGDTNGIGSASYLQIDNSAGLSYKINPPRIGIGTTNPTTRVQLSNTFGLEIATTTVATTSATSIDSLSATTYRSARFQVQITQGSSYQVSDVLVIHNGTTASLVEYASIATGDYLGEFSAIVSGGSLILRVSMFSASSATVKVVRYGITV
jgi:hypothetical protein